MFKTELRVRKGMKSELASIAEEVETCVIDISRRIKERDYHGITECIAELMEINTIIFQIDVRLRLSEKSDEIGVVHTIDQLLKMIRYARDDVRAVAQMTMNEANNAA